MFFSLFLMGLVPFAVALNEIGATDDDDSGETVDNNVDVTPPTGDLLTGTDFNDTIVGDDLADTIDAGAGPDEVWAGAGDDVVDGGRGADRLFGQDGDDTMDGGIGFDLVSGLAGDDSITGGWGEDQLYGGTGDDTIYGDGADDYIRGGDGNDILRGGEGGDDIDGQAGDDLIYGGSAKDVLFGGDGSDTLIGSEGADQLNGNAGGDMLRGGDGNDSLSAVGRASNGADAGPQADADTLFGDDGNDLLEGANATDETLYYGGDGNDTIIGNGAVFDGGAGKDLIDVTGNATVIAGEGADQIVTHSDGITIDLTDSDAASDEIEFGGSSNIINGFVPGEDALSFEELPDELSAQDDGEDLLLLSGEEVVATFTGLAGTPLADLLATSDQLAQLTTQGDDALTGTAGDTLTGGAGTDSFTIDIATEAGTVDEDAQDVDPGPIVIADFEAGEQISLIWDGVESADTDGHTDPISQSVTDDGDLLLGDLGAPIAIVQGVGRVLTVDEFPQGYAVAQG
ncbi:hypothetical protein BFP70_12825 [Thioclava sp. SK-1]|uniref:calcium-binding protein n=1 Tax=Thioclava sp. SK-1 TaxID=1889770 RepID=UPI000824CB8D|nr:calcium-binding protein [Thioclava sp. SK-1]OCX63093.1 hypothetical protein BFP70_12825 [Thioclava sp. SK-1]